MADHEFKLTDRELENVETLGRTLKLLHQVGEQSVSENTGPELVSFEFRRTSVGDRVLLRYDVLTNAGKTRLVFDITDYESF